MHTRRFQLAGRSAFALVISLGLLLTLGVPIASAHAKIIDADPKIGSTIAQAPTTITVTAAENMKPGPQNSNLFVYGPSGELISQGDAKVDLNTPTKMSVSITAEKDPGIYVVRWITVSAQDGDPDQGAFVFTVNPNASATPTPAPTKAAQPTPASTTAAATTGGTPLWAAVVIGGVAFLLGLGAGFAFGRRGSPTASSPSSDRGAPEEKKTTPTP